MDIKVIVATHKQYRMPSDNCYMPLHVGKQGKVDLGYLGDDSGDSISEKNGHYCELTGLYWAWKNLKSDYIGLVHYRRYLANRWRKRMFWKRDPFYSVLTKKEIEQLLKKTDIILPAKRHYFIESLYSHYSHTHYEEHLIITRNILEQTNPAYLEAYDRIMKKDLDICLICLLCQEKNVMNTVAGFFQFWKNWKNKWTLTSMMHFNGECLAE